MSSQQIRYVKREEVNIDKWDKCIDESCNRLIYGYSHYLDHMAKHWDALVLEDYEAVMPLTWNTKWGIKYLYQPPFTQQLGIFCRNKVTSSLISIFLDHISVHFRFAEIFLNYDNAQPGLKRHSNFILPLHSAYESIQKRYKYNLTRSLRKAGSSHFVYSGDIPLNTALEAYKNEYGSRIKHLDGSDFKRFEKLCFTAQKSNEVLLRGVCDESGGLLSVALLLQKQDRLYLLQSTTFAEGRKREANYFLIDRIIQEFSNSDRMLDFEGSDIPGISHFYRLFGSIDQPYFFYRFNNLPWWIRWAKQDAVQGS